jgi:hypothetical protein
LQRRYWQLVDSHLQATQALASGIHAVREATSIAATQGAYRFLNNDGISLAVLAQPLIEVGRQEVPKTCDAYALAVHDWSQLMFDEHSSKKDRLSLSSRRVPEGYELQTALLVSDRDGSPVAPAVLSLRAAEGVYCSRSSHVRQPQSRLDELEPTMAYLEQQNFGRPLVHVLDAEADSVWHFRQWSEHAQRWFLVRADDRLVTYAQQERRFSAICQERHAQQAFRNVRNVLYHGRRAVQSVAEATVTLTRPAQRNRPKVGDRQRIPGAPLTLRLVIVEVRDDPRRLLARWYLLTNLSDATSADTIALWYYWRWLIEKYFKLLKSAGMNVESWQQHTAAAIARRLLVASMACVTVWQLARSEHPQAEQARRFLVRLSGRQMKRNTTFTIPALLAGWWVLLAMLDALEQYSVDQLRAFAELARTGRQPQPP